MPEAAHRALAAAYAIPHLIVMTGNDLPGHSASGLVGIDQEYGPVARIREGLTPLPAPMGFGAADDPALTEAAWRMAGAELSALGIGVNFAPVADLAVPSRVIGARSFGADEDAVARHVRAAVRGMQSQGVAACPKHFPGHGGTLADSHHELPVVDDVALGPFQDTGAWLTMIGHLDVRSVDPGVPASLSDRVIRVLREDLGFGGVVVTDALDMKALAGDPGELAVRALLAGNDLLLMPADPEAAFHGIVRTAQSGRLPVARLAEAAERVRVLTGRIASLRRRTEVGTPAHQAIAARAAAAAITVVRGDPVLAACRVTAPPDLQDLAASLQSHLVPGEHRVHLVATPADLVPGAAVTVALGAPYVLADATSPTLIAAFGTTPHTVRALAAVLTGQSAPTGRLPVDLSA
ncbi:glycoside hydrolase family 3 protein [Longispora albida]|uniref:glycoside hydrolase family 3 protein n=1 Tax=Longispora albida TaxID=203523 RepID=UPI001FE17BE2|nr:glycoside hydrolase family 3 N-terminal domain-containing protein [Longispora albida]